MLGCLFVQSDCFAAKVVERFSALGASAVLRVRDGSPGCATEAGAEAGAGAEDGPARFESAELPRRKTGGGYPVHLG